MMTLTLSLARPGQETITFELPVKALPEAAPIAARIDTATPVPVPIKVLPTPPEVPASNAQPDQVVSPQADKPIVPGSADKAHLTINAPATVRSVSISPPAPAPEAK